MTAAISTENLERVYGSGQQKVVALKSVNLEVPSGRFVALKGRSGSGKTTLLNCLGGLDTPTSGSIQIFGRELTELNDQQLTDWRRTQVGFIFQSFGLLPTLSVYENVELMLRIVGLPYRQRREQIYGRLEQVGLKKWVNHRPYEMSGGQQQRLAIARALVARPRLILADEPTGELDTETAREILRLFQAIVRDEDVTILASTHDSLVDEYVDEVIHLQDGEIQKAG